MNYNKIIGSNIRYERQKRGLTIDELSTCIGIGAGFLGLIERGHRGTSIANLCHIADFFSLTLDQLIKQPLFETEDEVNESEDLRASKYLTANTIIRSFDSDELDVIIDLAKSLKRYDSIKNHTLINENDDNIEY